MCGIVGYAGSRNAVPVLLNGLYKLEYRGYDSAGVALIEDGELDAFVEKRYESFKSELGQKIRSGKATLSELAARASEMRACKLPGSGKQEYLEGVVNRVLFG